MQIKKGMLFLRRDDEDNLFVRETTETPVVGSMFVNIDAVGSYAIGGNSEFYGDGDMYIPDLVRNYEFVGMIRDAD